jgi:hypothetical protein
MGKKVYFVSGNEHKSLVSVFLENLLYQQKQDNGSPLFIEPGNDFFTNGENKKKMKGRGLRAFDYYPDLDITSIPLEKAKGLPAEGEKREIKLAEEKFTDIFIYGEIKPPAIPIVALADYILLVLKKNVYSTGFVYSLLKLLKENGIQKKILIIFSAVSYLEEAAAQFNLLRDELQGMLGERPDLQFGGFFPIDSKYLAHAAQKHQPCVKVFPQSSFHGVIKYITRTLNGLETYVHDLPFLYGLATLPKNG